MCCLVDHCLSLWRISNLRNIAWVHTHCIGPIPFLNLELSCLVTFCPDSRETQFFFLTSKGKLHITFHPKDTKFHSFIIFTLMYICRHRGYKCRLLLPDFCFMYMMMDVWTCALTPVQQPLYQAISPAQISFISPTNRSLIIFKSW